MERVLSGVFHRSPSDVQALKNKNKKDVVIPEDADTKKKIDVRGGVMSNDDLWCCKGQALPQPGENYKHHIVDEFFRGFIRSFSIAYVGKSCANLLFGFLSPKGRKNPIKTIQESLGLDAVQFGAFVGSFSGIFRTSNAILAYLRGVDDAKNAFLAGLLAGSSIMLESKDRRGGIALYLLVRSLDIYVKQLCRTGYLPYSRHAEPFLFGVANMPIIYGFLFDPSLLDPGYYNWILRMGVITDHGLNLTLRNRREHFFKTGEMLPFCSCSVGYHQGPCLHHVSTDWVYGLLRAVRIYVPVHVLPLLLFRSHKLFKEPVKTVFHSVKGIALSCMFLSSYVALVKGSECALRNVRQVDDGWHGILSGLITGFACYFEQPSRVSELMLYCFPRGLTAAYLYFKKQGVVRPVPYADVMMFSLAMALIMSRAKSDFKSTYYTILCYFLDTDNGDDISPPIVSMTKKVLVSSHQSPEKDSNRVSLLSIKGKMEADAAIARDEAEELERRKKKN